MRFPNPKPVAGWLFLAGVLLASWAALGEYERQRNGLGEDRPIQLIAKTNEFFALKPDA
jgi:hypothetical protein